MRCLALSNALYVPFPFKIGRYRLLYEVAAGLVDTLQACPKIAFDELSVSNLDYVPSGAFYEQDIFGTAASALSLASNLVSTTLIACKAW